MHRPASDFFVGVLLRRVFAEGGYASVRRRGASEAGAIFVVLHKRDGRLNLFRPAPAAELPSNDTDRHISGRVFELVAEDAEAASVDARLEKEERFDPDFWLLEIEGIDPASILLLASPED